MKPQIWLDDKSNIDLGFIVRGTSKRPGLPSTVDRTLSIAGRHGIYDFGADLNSRLFVYDCAVITRNYKELQRVVQGIAAHLVDRHGRPRLMRLKVAERPNQYFNVRYYGAFDIQRIMGTGLFSLPLIAADPFAYSEVTNDEVNWGSEIITFEDNYPMGYTGGEVISVTGNITHTVTVGSGSLSVRPKIILSGAGKNVSVSANGKSFRISDLAGKLWVIDGHHMTVTADGGNGLPNFDGDFIELYQGDNEMSITGVGLSCTMQVILQEQYL